MTRPSVDLLDPHFYVGDPHPAYGWMREHEPVYRDEKNALWAVTRMEDLLYPSANRDAAVFDRPDEIDFRRNPNPHVAFGLGTHFCLGANLARLTLRVFFEELSARVERIEALAPPAYEANVFIKGMRRFDVRLQGRGGAPGAR